MTVRNEILSEIKDILKDETAAKFLFYFQGKNIPKIIVPSNKDGWQMLSVMGINGEEIKYQDNEGNIEDMDLDSINTDELIDIYECLHEDIYGKEKRDS